MNNSQIIFAALRDALAKLYPTEQDARVVVADAGLDAHKIAFSPRAQTNWHNILAEAVRQKRLDVLLAVVRTAYGGNSVLTDAYAEYRAFIDHGGHMEAPAQLPAIGSIETGGGSYIAGNVEIKSGDFVGRDKITHIHQTLFSETDLQDQNNRRTLRQMVKKFWIEDVLEHSLNHEAALLLHLSDRSNLVENRPWKLLPQQDGETVRLLPPETHILDVFDQMNHRLLILGEPGAGKTTLLLELARVLLQRADATPGYPSPVVFNLSSWIERKAPLAEWLVDELRTRYNIPKKMAQAWVAQDKLLPLLDGLDEVQSAQRVACAEAINQFHAEHLVPLVVCSRVAEYENLTVRLKLQGAVLLQPLTTEQIDAYLNKAGPTLDVVHSTLQQDTELQVLAQSPLMLNIMTLAYQGVASAELNLTDATQTRRQHLFNAYIQRMFGRREVAPIYSARQTVRWLQWLATRLRQSGQTTLLIERMQPDWVKASGQKSSPLLLIMLLGGPLYGLIFGLISGLILKLIAALIGKPSNTVIVDLLMGLGCGLLFGLLDGFSGRFRKINPIEQPGQLRRKLKSSFYAIILGGIGGGLLFGLISGLMGGLRVGLLSGQSFGLVFGMIGGLISVFREIEPVKQPGWSWQRVKGNLHFWLIVGTIFGMIFGMIFPLGSGLGVWLLSGLLFGTLFGLLFGLIGGLFFQSSTRTEPLLVVETQMPNQGIRLSVQYALFTSLIVGTIVGLIIGLLFGLNNELEVALGMGVTFGLTFGLGSGLIVSGADVMKHCLLRLVLWLQRHIPWNYARFLDYATALIFLRKIGGGYIFVHRLILEHFAGLDEQAIERITASSDVQ